MQTIVIGLCNWNEAAPLGLTIHNQMKVVASTILGVHNPSIGFYKGQINVHSFRPKFLTRNHFAHTKSIVASESTQLFVQSSKKSKRSTMNEERDGWIIVPTPDDPGGHQNTSFVRELGL